MCVSGGEPTLYPGIVGFMERIKALGFAVKLDTNGSRPDVLKELVDKNLIDYVAVDVKNGPEDYGATCGLEAFDPARIEESILILLEGKTDYELRTTVCKPLHSRQSIQNMASWLQNLSKTKAKRLFIQPFVDRDTVPFAGLSAPEKAGLEEYRAILSASAEQVCIRGI